MNHDSVALLPVGNYFPRMNATDYEQHPLWRDGLNVVEVWRNEKGQLSIAMGAGREHYHAVGDQIVAHHDQAGYTFGVLTLEASIVPGHVIGWIPDRKLPVRVYK